MAAKPSAKKYLVRIIRFLRRNLRFGHAIPVVFVLPKIFLHNQTLGGIINLMITFLTPIQKKDW